MSSTKCDIQRVAFPLSATERKSLPQEMSQRHPVTQTFLGRPERALGWLSEHGSRASCPHSRCLASEHQLRGLRGRRAGSGSQGVAAGGLESLSPLSCGRPRCSSPSPLDPAHKRGGEKGVGRENLGRDGGGGEGRGSAREGGEAGAGGAVSGRRRSDPSSPFLLTRPHRLLKPCFFYF